jgi:hypothetical protein
VNARQQQLDKILTDKGKGGFVPKINTAWFRERLADKKISQRKLAKLMELDPAAISYMLRGLRRMTIDEAIAIATIIGRPHEEVLMHAGVRHLPSAGKNMVRVVGWVDGQGLVHLGAVKGMKLVVAPPGLPEDAIALRYQTSISAAETMDGWIVYTTAGHAVNGGAIGRLSIAQVANKGPLVVGMVSRGYSAGTYNVLPWVPGGLVLEDVILESASPVLWVKTA